MLTIKIILKMFCYSRTSQLLGVTLILRMCSFAFETGIATFNFKSLY